MFLWVFAISGPQLTKTQGFLTCDNTVVIQTVFFELSPKFPAGCSLPLFPIALY
jgi:hypothetical protein